MSDFDKLANALEKSIGANDTPAQVKYWLDTGLPELNAAASGRYDGGFPVGRIVEISGDASSGKTVIATRLMTEAQMSGGIAAFHDHERTFSEKLAERNGLSLERGKWLYKKPDTFEDSFEMFAKAVSIIRESKLIPEDAPICYVFDSFAAMIPASQFGKDFNKLNMNDTTALARVASQVMKQVAVLAEKYNVLVIILNQIREKPGIVYGDNKDTAGGKSLKFYASIRISLSSSKIKDGDEIIGNHIRALFIKNKVTRPFARAEYDFIFREDGTGDIDNVGSTLEFMGRKGLIEKAGSYYKWGDKKMYMSAIKKEVSEVGGMKLLEGILEGKSVEIEIDKDAEAAAERLKEEGLADLEGI